jgi:16S rRNA (guanine1207-N2)-methyltransferase
MIRMEWGAMGAQGTGATPPGRYRRTVTRSRREPQDETSGDRTDHYFTASPAAPTAPRTVTLSLPDLHLDLVADRGVFSADRVDPGTRVLLLEAPAPGPDVTEALDLGCGYGPIALTLAHRAPSARVWAVDVNERARALCAANAAAAGTGGRVVAAAPDEVPDDVSFDLIWSNPPVRIGKEALHSLLARWLDRLTPEGRAVLVVQRHLGADSLARWLVGEGWRVERLASRQAYRLMEVRR